MLHRAAAGPGSIESPTATTTQTIICNSAKVPAEAILPARRAIGSTAATSSSAMRLVFSSATELTMICVLSKISI